MGLVTQGHSHAFFRVPRIVTGPSGSPGRGRKGDAASSGQGAGHTGHGTWVAWSSWDRRARGPRGDGLRPVPAGTGRAHHLDERRMRSRQERGAKAASGHPASGLSDSAQWQLRPPRLHPQSHETAHPRDNVSGKSYTATHKARRTPAWPEDMFPSGDSPDPLPDRAPSSPISARPTITWREGTRPVSHAHPASSSLPM